VERLLRIAPWGPGDAPVSEVDEQRLVGGLRQGAPWATAALVDRHGTYLRRVLIRVLGADDREHQDLLQEVFTRALEGIGRLSEASALKAWLTNIAVFTAREAIRKRRRRRWLSFMADVPEPEPTQSWAGPDLREAAGCVYRIFERMPADERIPFALRMLHGMDLVETAVACGMSVATVRRRMARAEQRFYKLARQYEALTPWWEDR